MVCGKEQLQGSSTTAGLGASPAVIGNNMSAGKHSERKGARVKGDAK